MREEVNVLIGGEAGQGLVTIGGILVKALVRSGYFVAVLQAYESRIRGGHNTFVVRAGVNKVDAPREGYDVVVALNDETVRFHRDELADGGIVIAAENHESAVDSDLRVPYRELASGKYVNTVALGVASAALGLKEDLLTGLLELQFGKKHPEAVEPNAEAVRKSYEWFESNRREGATLGAPPEGPERVAMNANEAVALGAISAGVRFSAFYPMTPSTSIPLTLIASADRCGLVVEQAEDEIAAINMAIGASYAGAPAMVATSGGGFALMTEGVSLAAMTETPILVVVAQRPAPATGLPTRTEQADLEFVLHAGHGEFPRAIFSPGTVEQCFHLTRQALELAERAQGPVFLLTDQHFADTFRAVEPFDFESLEPVAVPREDVDFEIPYRRYALAESGVSPRLLPGRSEHLVVVDSDEHDEAGHITEDLEFRKKIVEKRLRKGEILLEEVVPPEYSGDDGPDILLVSWGTTRGSCLEAAAAFRERGKSAAVLHFPQVWPLVPEGFVPRLEAAESVVAVESNATAQFARLLRRETGFDIPRRILRYDGLPITPEYIVRGLEKEAIL